MPPNDKVTVYTPESGIRRPAHMLGAMWRDLRASRELAWRLAVRDLSVQYRQAALGFLWAILLPLSHTAVWLFLNGSGIVAVGETALPYAAHVFTGTMLWAIFTDAVNAPLQVTGGAKPILAKINFPREALVVSGIYQTLFNASIKIGLMLGVLLMMGIMPGWGLLFFPLGIASLILAGTALGLLLTPVGMLYTDVGKSVPLLLQFLMYLSPVIFPMPESGWAARLFELNPLTPLILTARDWLTGAAPDFLGYFMVVSMAALLLLFIVWVMYRLAMPILVERMSA
jgi:lipopolysaccharide transport system permease protein